MARSELDKLLNKLESGAFFFFKQGLENTAENIVKDLQTLGPTW